MRSLLILSILLLTSCASYQKGEGAFVVKGKHPDNTPIKGYIDHTYSTKYYTLIQLNFGNYSKDWKRVESASLDFNDEKLNKKIKIPVGDDLTTWAESIKNKIAVDNHNSAILLGTLALAGTAAMASNNSNTSVAGAAVALGAVSVQGFNDIKNTKDRLEMAKLVPRSHLFSPFSIPAGLVTKKWILLQAHVEELPGHIYLNLKYKEPKADVRYKVRIRDVSGRLY